MTPEFTQGLTPDALKVLLEAKEKIEATPDDATKIGKVIWHETTERAQIVPVLIYEDGTRQKLPDWREPLPLVGSLVRYGFMGAKRKEVAEVIFRR
jgi:hypothetical protein